MLRACTGLSSRSNEISANRIHLSRASVRGCVGGRSVCPGEVWVDAKGWLGTDRVAFDGRGRDGRGVAEWW